jgi:tetratricopeptide (TPR) repeat protein
MPSSGIIQSGLWPAYANRFMYLPIIGILILLVWELDERIKGDYANVLKIILCIALTVYFSLMTRVQNVYFTNSYSLFHRSLEVVPDNALGLNNISVHLINLGRHKEAMTYLERGMKAFPTKPSYYQNYGICLVANGDEEGAIRHFRKAISLDPKLYGAYLNLGLIYSKKGQDDEALPLIGKAMKLKPGDASIHHHYGNLLTKMGRHKEALPHFQYAAKKDYSDLKIRLNLAQSYQLTGRLDQAMAEYKYLEREIKDNKGYIYYGMAGIYSQKKMYDQCIDYLRKAQESDFDVIQFLKSDTRFDNFRTSKYYDQFVKLNRDKNKDK